MSVNRQKYKNLYENKNHLTVVSRAHNTIESLENQAQDTFSVERTPRQFYMQRMGQLQIFSYGRGRYNLKYYQNLESLNFPGEPKMFETDYEPQESFAILPERKKRNMIQIPTFFRIFPTVKKLYAKPERKESLIFPKLSRPDFELKNENNFVIQRQKRFENIIETINDIKIKAEGKFFHNRPTLKKKSNLEIEYLIIKAPFKTENVTNVVLENIPKKTRYDNDIQTENKFDINYNMGKIKGFHPEKIYIGVNSNFFIPHKEKKTSFKPESIQLENTSNVFLVKQPREKPKEFLIDDQPDLFIQEWPGKRYCSVGMESMTFIGNLRPEFCLEIDPNEEIFVPNVYDMLLIQNFWDNLEQENFRLTYRPVGYHSKKNEMKEIELNNKENINENKEGNDNKELPPIKENEEIKDESNIAPKESENKDGSGSVKRYESSDVLGYGKKKKSFKFKDLKKSVFGKK